MPREAQDITEGELAVLQVLWQRPARSIRQITETLYPKHTAPHYGTLQKQLERLEAKGFVRRDRSLFVHLFSAAIGRDELVGRRVQEMVDKLCEGSLAPVLSHLFKAKPLSAAERQALRDLIDNDESSPRDSAEGKGKTGRNKRTR